MKYKIFIFVLLLMFVASCTDRVTGGAEDVVIEDAVPQPEAINGYQRFLKVTEFNDVANNKTIRDTITLELNRMGDSISGKLFFKPQEKDKKQSIYRGIISGNSARVIAVSAAEGVEYREQLFFTLTDSAVAIKFGEMAKGRNGIWYYKNKNTAYQEVLERVK